MNKVQKNDSKAQALLLGALLKNLRKQPLAKRVSVRETHISWVLLSGHYAYKIKKSIDLGFLNFSNLQLRRFYCEEEIRLSRRLAPNLYLDIISIGGNPDMPVLGGHPVLEYAVKMRRFSESSQLDKLVSNNKLLPQHIDSLAISIANFHQNLPSSSVSDPFGSAQSIRMDVEQNFAQLDSLLPEQSDLAMLALLRSASENEFASCHSLFEQRLKQGCVRECHGDLHLGNIALIAQVPTPFDGIEFNPALRWIDVISEVAFTVMDLLHYQRADLAYRFLNAYIEVTGDYTGIPLLRFYIAYRAMVRAKVSAIRASQAGISMNVSALEWGRSRNYLQQAANSLAHKSAALIITHGLPGSGKSTFAQLAVERFYAIRLRSDVERKRLFGLTALADSQASIGINLYGADITKKTYARLFVLAQTLLAAGYVVIVDAAFLQEEERERFSQLAATLTVPFAIASLQAGTETLRARIAQRHHAAIDASEADIAVLEKMQISQQPLSSSELRHTAEFENERVACADDGLAWNKLSRLLNGVIST